MKFANSLRTVAAAVALATAAQVGAAPILSVSNGILTGAAGVDVGGKLYNVTFADGSCATLFNGCIQSAFAFNSQSDAVLAANALIDQVFVNGLAGQFDTQPYNVFGCTNRTTCTTFVPYSVRGNGVSAAYAVNGNLGDSVSQGTITINAGTGPAPAINFALFQLVPDTVDVPEPSSIALFGLAIAGLAITRRRKM